MTFGDLFEDSGEARTLQQGYAQGPTVVLRGEAVSYERGTPVEVSDSEGCEP